MFLDSRPRNRYRFNLYENRLPEGLSSPVKGMLLSARDAMSSLQPVSLVVAYTPVRWDFTPNSIQYHAIGNFPPTFDMINTMAKHLAPTYLQFGILPLINPYTMEEWIQLENSRFALHDKITRRGILAFQAKELQ